MSVARSSLSKAPWYTWRSSDVGSAGLHTLNSGKLFDAAASDSVAVVIGQHGSTAGFWTTTNGSSFTRISSPLGTNTALMWSIAYGNNTFVAVGGSNVIATSPGTSGTTWTIRTSAGVSGTTIQLVRFVNGYFIATQSSGGKSFQYSTDGISWTATTNATVTTGSAPLEIAQQGNLLYHNGIYIHMSGQTSTTSEVRIVQSKEVSFNTTTSITSTASYMFMQDLGDGRPPLAHTYTASTAYPGYYGLIDQQSASAWITFQASGGVQVPYPGFRGGDPVIVGGTVSRSDAAIVTNYLSSLSGIAGGISKRPRYYYSDGYYQMLFPELSGAHTTNGRTASIVWRDDTDTVIESAWIPGSYSNINFFNWGSAVSFKFKGKEYIIDGAIASNSYARLMYIGTYATRSLLTTTKYR